MATKKNLGFVDTILATHHKTDEQLVKESLVEFQQDAVISTEEQIAQYQSQLKRDEIALRRATTTVEKAQLAVTEAKYTPASSYNEYIKGINCANQALAQAQTLESTAKAQVENTTKSIEFFTDLLAIVSAE